VAGTHTPERQDTMGVPKRLAIDPDTPDAGALGRAAGAIRAGGIVAYPTDTLYGLAVDPRDAAAVARVFALKGRGADRALPLIAASVDQVLGALGPLSPDERRLVDACWPGPLTLAMRTSAALAPDVSGEGGTVAVRVPAHAVARGLARAVGHPITATSANVSGRPGPDDPEEVAALGDAIALLLDAGRTPGGPPSTIVRLEPDGPRLLREGAIPFARVLELLR